jgi:hypothetical protein
MICKFYIEKFVLQGDLEAIHEATYGLIPLDIKEGRSGLHLTHRIRLTPTTRAVLWDSSRQACHEFLNVDDKAAASTHIHQRFHVGHHSFSSKAMIATTRLNILPTNE